MCPCVEHSSQSSISVSSWVPFNRKCEWYYFTPMEAANSKLKQMDLEVRSKYGLWQKYISPSGCSEEQSGQLFYSLQFQWFLLPISEDYLHLKWGPLGEGKKLLWSNFKCRDPQLSEMFLDKFVFLALIKLYNHTSIFW